MAFYASSTDTTESPPPPGVGVVLVAHGSARSRASAEPVLSLARELRRRGYPEVRAGFWKEEPFLHQVLLTLRSPRVVVLPVFMAEGYFTRVVVPREMGLEDGARRTERGEVRLLPPLGTAPEMREIVLDRARESLPDPRRAADAALVVLGHGTPRDAGSAGTVRDVARELDRRGIFARVVPAFIDQEPRMEDAVAEAPESTVVVVPFLVSRGWHGGVTVPRDLGVEEDAPGPDGTSVVYAGAVGLHPRVPQVVDGILGRAIAPHEVPPPSGPESELDRAARLLARRLDGGRAFHFLQVTLRKLPEDGYELRSAEDAGADDAALRDLSGPEALREVARHRVDGEHRPLRTRGDLRGGWRLRVPDPPGLADALVALYGAAIVDWSRSRTGDAVPISFPAAAARQTGIYAGLENTDAATLDRAVESCCRGLPCLREPVWDGARRGAGAPREPIPVPEGTGASVPCLAPCPALLTAVLEARDEADGEGGGIPGEGG